MPAVKSTVKPGYKTTEGWLSLLAFVGSALVAVKAVPVNVNTAMQADAVKALPVIAVGYAIARSIAKVGWRQTLPLIESELGIPSAAGTTTVTFPPVVAKASSGVDGATAVPVSADPTAPAVTTAPADPPVPPSDPPSSPDLPDDVPPPSVGTLT